MADDDKKKSWADEAEEDAKLSAPVFADDGGAAEGGGGDDGGDAPPPGFSAEAKGSHDPKVEEEAETDKGETGLEKVLEGTGVKEAGEADDPDEPDLALKSAELDKAGEEESAIKTVVAGDTPYTSAKCFEDLPISDELRQGLYVEMKFEKPSKIQAQTLPMILEPPFHNLIAQAHNGSGKTTCFVLSMLSRVEPSNPVPQALCVCPTRELAVQNFDVLQKMGKFTTITSTWTGHPRFGDYSSRREKIVDQVVIGTPGTIKGWVSKKLLGLRGLRILVFDEADEMMKQDGFADDSLRIMRDIKKESPKCQVLLFSATFNDKTKRFCEKVVTNANQVFVEKEKLSLSVIKQYRVVCPTAEAKSQVLSKTIFPLCDKLGQTIIFVRTRDEARKLHTEMQADGHKCTSIQGDMQHEDRDRVIREFRAGSTKILIATDVLARGFDQNSVTLVVNYSVPVERDRRTPGFETYLHRIGRSGRFGRKGAAFNLVQEGYDDVRVLQEIENYFQHPIPDVQWDDEDQFETVLTEAGLMEKSDV
mmetsp:Transcript_68748/g.217422  ORF Transcript_68748/g.217422 Transcript_68748/m.217422 type:complete len:534 (+) Transcript_68748:149-1750(+)